MAIKLPRTIRLDATDTRVFARAAEAGEWAIPGGFVFADVEPEALTGKTKQEFASGFLGLGSFGWSSVVCVAPIGAVEFAAAIERLAAHLLAHYGAPDLDTARDAARGELNFAAGLCDHPANTLLTLSRRLVDGEIREAFRAMAPRGAALHQTIWEIVPEA